MRTDRLVKSSLKKKEEGFLRCASVMVLSLRIKINDGSVIAVTLPSGHMTSFLPSILERDPPLLLSWRVLSILFYFPPWEGFSYLLGVFPEVKGQGCRMCRDFNPPVTFWGQFDPIQCLTSRKKWTEFFLLHISWLFLVYWGQLGKQKIHMVCFQCPVQFDPGLFFTV